VNCSLLSLFNTSRTPFFNYLAVYKAGASATGVQNYHSQNNMQVNTVYWRLIWLLKEAVNGYPPLCVWPKVVTLLNTNNLQANILSEFLLIEFLS